MQQGINGRTIHFSDYGSQPEIRVACTQSYHHPWTSDKSLPEDIFEVADKEQRLYTFDAKLVTCKDCKNLNSWKQNYSSIRRFEIKLELLGMTSLEYYNWTNATMGARFGKESWPEGVPELREFDDEELDRIWMERENINSGD